MKQAPFPIGTILRRVLPGSGCAVGTEVRVERIREPIIHALIDEYRDGCSIYETKHGGRAIYPDAAHEWEVVATSPPGVSPGGAQK